MTLLNINESIQWLNTNSMDNWSRSKFWRMRKLNYFNGTFRADKNVDHFTENSLRRGCEKIGIPIKKRIKKIK
jgi:hypothetical protein